MVLASIPFWRRSRLQAKAMVIWSNGLKRACSSKRRLKVKQPSLSSFTSDSQYATSSSAKLNVPVCLACQVSNVLRPETESKSREWHLKERQRVNKRYSVKSDLHQFASVSDLLHDTILSVIFVDHEIAIVALKIVCDHCHRAGVVSCQSIQPFEKVSNTCVTFETERAVILLGLGHN